MKNQYSVPQVEVDLVAIEQNLLATGVSLSGSSGENLGGKTNYGDDWEDVV